LICVGLVFYIKLTILKSKGWLVFYVKLTTPMSQMLAVRSLFPFRFVNTSRDGSLVFLKSDRSAYKHQKDVIKTSFWFHATPLVSSPFEKLNQFSQLVTNEFVSKQYHSGWGKSNSFFRWWRIYSTTFLIIKAKATIMSIVYVIASEITSHCVLATLLCHKKSSEVQTQLQSQLCALPPLRCSAATSG